MSLESGKRLGPYEIVGPIGAGGMGEVYKATDTRLDRTVAIKVLPAHLAESSELKQRFEREAKAISQLNHPYICTLYDVGEQDGVDYLVMEHIEGETLAARLGKGPLPLEVALDYGAQIADGLDTAHRAGIVHRDLKPGNVMLTISGIKLLDFGLAKLVVDAKVSDSSDAPTQAQQKSLTGQQTVIGTLQYMAPEQLEGKTADVRTDVFAFGATLYEMITGRKAFEGESQASLITAIMSTEPAPILMPALQRAIQKCLAKDPDSRWQTARDLRDEVKWIAEGGSSGDTSLAKPAASHNARAAWGLTGALLASVLTAVVF